MSIFYGLIIYHVNTGLYGGGGKSTVFFFFDLAHPPNRRNLLSLLDVDISYCFGRWVLPRSAFFRGRLISTVERSLFFKICGWLPISTYISRPHSTVIRTISRRICGRARFCVVGGLAYIRRDFLHVKRDLVFPARD